MKKTQLENYFFGNNHFSHCTSYRKKYQLKQKIKILLLKAFILCFITGGLGLILSLQSCKEAETDQVILTEWEKLQLCTVIFTEGQKLQLFILKQPILFK
jgi:hypothetical protein